MRQCVRVSSVRSTERETETHRESERERQRQRQRQRDRDRETERELLTAHTTELPSLVTHFAYAWVHEFRRTSDLVSNPANR